MCLNTLTKSQICTFLLKVFFFNDTATTEIYTLSLHDALPISQCRLGGFLHHIPQLARDGQFAFAFHQRGFRRQDLDRKSTRLNSSHANISYAVFCLKNKGL